MTDTPTATQTPNVVVADPRVRKAANVVLGIVGLLVGVAVVTDLASPEIDLATYTTPVAAVYAFLASVFGLAVTTPNIPRV